MLIFLDFLVFLFGVAGALLLIYKKKIGFLSFVIHSIVWGALSLYSGNYWAAVTCLVFIVIDTFGYWKWSKEDESTDK